MALHLDTLGYIPRLLNTLNGLVYFLIIGDPRGDNLIVGSIFRKLLTELGIQIEDAECNLMGEICNFENSTLTDYGYARAAVDAQREIIMPYQS